MKRVAILGSTGSIGVQTLAVVDRFPDALRVVGLAARSDGEGLRAQAETRGVRSLALADESAAVRFGLPGGLEAVTSVATAPDVDIVVVAVAGVVGLLPTLAAIDAGKAIALASKEVLVAAGEIVMPRIRERGVALTPIDSEHSAIFQCLRGYAGSDVNRIVLTASGGPFRGWTRERLAHVDAAQALNHPTWSMGGKITVDSATLMNKGLETIEARWLFDVPLDRVDVVVHPQSIVHSFVELRDGSFLAQLGWPDMQLPIQVALLHPERLPSGMRPWDPLAGARLDFEPVDTSVFRCLDLAREASRAGGTMPCAMNAANEHAANAFLRGDAGFLDIEGAVEHVMAAHQPVPATLDSILATDTEARERCAEYLRSLNSGPAPAACS